jgi:phosphatidylglycerophosphatase A
MSEHSKRRPLDWSLVRTPRTILAVFVATAGGAGLGPWAPGTWGTLVGIPIAYFTRDWPISVRLGLWAGLLAIGTWSAEVFDRTMQSTDNQNIVIDEVVGMGITSWTVTTSMAGLTGFGYIQWLVAFLLFRTFDVWKPYPIRLLDRWSKTATGMSGFGVMADDVLAGVYGLLVMIALRYFGVFQS